MTGPTEPDVRPDTDAAEDFAEEVGVDPTQEEIDRYRVLEGEAPAEDEADAALADPSVS
jgi:hypothetical protein